MITSIVAFILSLLAIGFLIFIHEFGHYWMARRVGMRVETFSIGMGSPIYEWKRKNGEIWQLGWLPFGGYVKITGTDKDIEDPYAVPDGFFGRGPWARIKVAFMGPFVNILFTFLAFTAIWLIGGRSTDFRFYNNVIGNLDKASPLYQEGLRPGDEILSINGKSYQDFQMLVLEFLKKNGIHLDVQRPPQNGVVTPPFQITLSPTQEAAETKASLIPFMPANFIVFDPSKNLLKSVNKSRENIVSGIEKNDILVWFDGSVVYSIFEFRDLINENRALLTIQRGNDILLKRVPRVAIGNIKLDYEFKNELNDWQYESGLLKSRLGQLVFIPYTITSENIVDSPVKFIDKEETATIFPAHTRTPSDEQLKEGDKILAIDGVAVRYPYQLFKQIQDKRYLSIVYRDPKMIFPKTYDDASALFKRIHDPQQFAPLLANLGSSTEYSSYNDFTFLQPITVTADDLADPAVIENLEKKNEVQKSQDSRFKKVFELAGLYKSSDLSVSKETNPFKMMMMSVVETYVPLYLMVTGKAKMDMVRGPIGVFEVVTQGLMDGLSNALYILGFISLNLALINLLPFPVLDGGSIVISAFEKVTGKRLTIKTLERLIIPFALLILFAMIYFTFNDIMRIFKG